MLTVVLIGSFKEAQRQILQTKHLADAYEFRLDTFEDIKVPEVAALVQQLNQVTIFTYRMKNHGGAFDGSYEERWKLFEPYLKLSPDYIDLEKETPPVYINQVRKKYSKIKIILSHHYLITPACLETEIEALLKQQADVYKVVTTASTSLDALKMLHISQYYKEKKIPFVGICMGEKGVLTRLLAPVVDHAFTYCCSDPKAKIAPGQLCIEELCSTYHHQYLNTETKVYALLGHPVTQSPSHYTHNRLFHQLGINAIYVKIDLFPEEFDLFLNMLHALPFEGFSITVPFKELAWKRPLSSSTQNIGSINTLYKREGEWIGANTDGIGAVRALEKEISLQNQRCLIIGAGGTARAIAYELLRKQVCVTVLNRTKERALTLAHSLKCSALGFEDIQELPVYDILINTTTVGREEEKIPLQEQMILSHKTVMDVLLNPVETQLLKIAQQRGCKIVHGYSMFIYQAAEQFRLWLAAPLEGIETLLKEYYLAFRARECGFTFCSSRNL